MIDDRKNKPSEKRRYRRRGEHCATLIS